MDLQITLKENITVRPCEQPNRQTVELSGLDRISPAVLYTVFFYKSQMKIELSSEAAYENHVERAKCALQKVLFSWYPAAGRFKFNKTTGKLEIDCNSEGVTMTIAETDSKLQELGWLHEYKSCYEKLVPKLPEANDTSENPLVVVQITRFACGGISIGFGVSHALFDGAGTFSFLAAWAYLSNGKEGSDLIVPDHSRDALLQAIYSPNSSLATASIYEQDHVAGIQDLYGIPMKAMASNDRCWETALSKFGQIEPQGELVLVTLRMKKEVVETWKGAAIERGKLSKCSTFDVLCAHVWKARVMALKLHPSTQICLQFPVDSRSRFRPPLGENFTGNAFVLASVPCLVRDLLEEPLHCTIQKIQAAKDVITNEYIKLYAKALESSDKFFPSMRELTIVTDWMRFPFHALDFGWGRVSSAALLATPVPETAFLLPNLEESAGFLVRIGVGRQHVHHLVNNFNNFNYGSTSSSSTNNN